MNYWNLSDVPHKGWTYLDCVDAGEANEVCEMCGNENIRWVHLLEHIDYPELDIFHVGCVCAEKMTNNYVKPKRTQEALKNKVLRNEKAFCKFKKRWRELPNGSFLNFCKEEFTYDISCSVFINPQKSGSFMVNIKIGAEIYYGKKVFSSFQDAEKASWEYVKKRKEKN